MTALALGLAAILTLPVFLRGEAPSLDAGAAGAAETAEAAPPPAPPPVAAPSEQMILSCAYYDRESFYAAVTAPPLYSPGEGLQAGLVPHHLVASDMLAGFFNAAAGGGYQRVVVVSTSHFPQQCAGDVVTGIAGWATPHGDLRGDEALPRALLSNRDIAAVAQPSALERDHGVAGLMPFIAYYLPGVRVSAALLSNRLSQERLEAVTGELLAACADGKTLFVASADCSHYLTAEEAALRDLETIAAVEGLDYRGISRFTDDNIDSPQALTLLLRLAEQRNLSLSLLDHSDSAQKLPYAAAHPAFDEGVTTYLVYGAAA